MFTIIMYSLVGVVFSNYFYCIIFLDIIVRIIFCSPFLFPFECRQSLFFLTSFDRDRGIARLQVIIIIMHTHTLA